MGREASRRFGERSGRRGGGSPSGFTFSVAESGLMVPNTALMLATHGVTHPVTTVTQWSAQFGGKAANVVLTPPAPTNEPAYLATGGPGGGPAIQFDGIDNVLRSAGVTPWGFSVASISIDVWGVLAGAETAGDCVARYTGGDNITLSVTAAPVGRVATAGTGGGTTPGSTTLTGTHRRMQATGISGPSGSQAIVIDGVVEGTAAITHAAWSDGGAFSLGASPAGSTPVALTCVAWALTLGESAATALTAEQSAYLDSLVSHYIKGLS